MLVFKTRNPSVIRADIEEVVRDFSDVVHVLPSSKAVVGTVPVELWNAFPLTQQCHACR